MTPNPPWDGVSGTLIPVTASSTGDRHHASRCPLSPRPPWGSLTALSCSSRSFMVSPRAGGARGGSPSSPTAGMGDVALGPPYIQARWRVALSLVPVPKPGAVPALIPRDGHKEGAEGRDELEPPFTWDTLGHWQRLWVPPVTLGGDSGVGTDVGWPQLGSDGEVCPQEGHAQTTCPFLLWMAALGDTAGDGGHVWGERTWLGDTTVDKGHSWRDTAGNGGHGWGHSYG